MAKKNNESAAEGWDRWVSPVPLNKKKPKPAPVVDTSASGWGSREGRVGTQIAALPTQWKPPTPVEEAPPDYMALLKQLMGMGGGGGGSSVGSAASWGVGQAFDASPYQGALQNLTQQAALGQQAIQTGGQDLMSRLAQIQEQFGTRNAEDVAAIQGTQQKALQQAQGSLNPVLADLRAQGVNVAPVEQMANTRIGALGEQAALQNTLSQRMAQNANNTFDATNRSAALQQTGALNQLAQNLMTGSGQITAAQAKAAAQHQQEQMRALQAYQRAQSSGGGGRDPLDRLSTALGIIGKLQGEGDANDPMSEVRTAWATREGDTAEGINELFGYLDTGDFTDPDDIIGNLDTKRTVGGEDITGWEEMKLKYPNLNVSTAKAAIRAAAKQPKAAKAKGLDPRQLGLL